MKAFYQVVIIGVVFSILFFYGVQKALFASDARQGAVREESLVLT